MRTIPPPLVSTAGVCTRRTAPRSAAPRVADAPTHKRKKLSCPPVGALRRRGVRSLASERRPNTPKRRLAHRRRPIRLDTLTRRRRCHLSQDAGASLVVVGFSTSWCGPCKARRGRRGARARGARARGVVLDLHARRAAARGTLARHLRRQKHLLPHHRPTVHHRAPGGSLYVWGVPFCPPPLPPRPTAADDKSKVRPAFGGVLGRGLSQGTYGSRRESMSFGYVSQMEGNGNGTRTCCVLLPPPLPTAAATAAATAIAVATATPPRCHCRPTAAPLPPPRQLPLPQP